MIVQHENKILSNLVMFLDHTLLKTGQAFTNHTSYFNFTDRFTYFLPAQPTVPKYLYNYSAPFKQFVYDDSILGANVLKKLRYRDGNPVNGFDIGANGFVGINHNDGIVRFNIDVFDYIHGTENPLQGDYAIKDFNFYLTNQSESTLLFEEKIHLRPKINETIKNLPKNNITYPCVFVKSMYGENKSLTFSSFGSTELQVRLIILADSLFLLDAACSIFRDLTMSRFYFLFEPLAWSSLKTYDWGDIVPHNGKRYVTYTQSIGVEPGSTYSNERWIPGGEGTVYVPPIWSETSLPLPERNTFNAYGDYVGTPFNYDLLSDSTDRENHGTITNIYVSKNVNKDFNSINKEIHAAFVDLTVSTLRKFRT